MDPNEFPRLLTEVEIKTFLQRAEITNTFNRLRSSPASELKRGSPKVFLIHLKCSDCFFGEVLDEQENSLIEYSGYALTIPGVSDDKVHFGDYVEFKIDIETGKLLGWDPTFDLMKQLSPDYDEDDDNKDDEKKMM